LSNSESGPFSELPHIAEEQWAACEADGDYWPVAFEYYKYVGHLCSVCSNIDRRSPAVHELSTLEFGVLVGLLNRCARLMLANLSLFSSRLFRETTTIVDRCIFESCIKLAWLCQQNSPESLERFLADGLKAELELKDHVEANVAGRGGAVLPIEQRMVAATNALLESADLDAAAVLAAKKLPDLASMMRDLGLERLHYVVLQRGGSHSVHGTWPALRRDFLELDGEGELVARDHDCATQVDQLVVTMLHVLIALNSFVGHVFEDDVRKAFAALFADVNGELKRLYERVVGQDFDVPAADGQGSGDSVP